MTDLQRRLNENSATKAIRKLHVNKHDFCWKGEVNRRVHNMTLIFCLYQLSLLSAPKWEVVNNTV